MMADRAPLVVEPSRAFRLQTTPEAFFLLPTSYKHNTMSQSVPTAPSSSSSSNFQSIFNAAVEAYEKTTKNKLLTHPLASQIQACDTPTAIISVLQDLVQQFDQSRSRNEGLRSWLDPTVNVLFAFSATLGQGVGLVILNGFIS
jgi:hypothetical protein